MIAAGTPDSHFTIYHGHANRFYSSDRVNVSSGSSAETACAVTIGQQVHGEWLTIMYKQCSAMQDTCLTCAMYMYMHLTCTVQHIQALCNMHISHHIVYLCTSSAVDVLLHTVRTVHIMHNVHVHCQQLTLPFSTLYYRFVEEYVLMYRMEIYNKEKLSIQCHGDDSACILSQKGQTGLCHWWRAQHCSSIAPLQSTKRDSWFICAHMHASFSSV